jgi:hypothetical protein
MTRLHFLLAIGCLTGAAASVAPASPTRPAPTPPAPSVALPTARSAPAQGQANITWLDRFGTYNVRQGSWSFILNANGC